MCVEPLIQSDAQSASPRPWPPEESGSAAFQAYYNIERIELLDLLVGFKPTRALELGCGSGATLSALKRRFPTCHTVGVERQADAAHEAMASGMHEIHVADAAGADFDFPADKFDLVILSHVLEHFEQPAAILQKVQRWTASDVRLLVALPNLRHYSVLADLIVRDDFRYREHGILDRTHLRFFTRRSAIRLFEEQGFKVISSRPEVAGRLSRLLSRASFGRADGFAAFAYNFQLRKASACAS